ncbi:unnamed protein product [Paramecium sonneborni]|uniref:G domain-containing protein n=1 Tax=Paramecium sonneborni TaxID=65129 RepID=A0A8S1RK86_9CILI|nr:unnamed protein product [Paramecium sonneborni]
MSSSSFSKLQDDDDYKICCSIHNRPANFCLNEYCNESRIFCPKCLNEGKHTHLSSICYFTEMLEVIQNKKDKIQSIIELLNYLIEQILSFENKLKQKYNISKEELFLMNHNQLSTFIDHILKNENEFNNILSTLKINFNSINETFSQSSQTLQLDLNQYSWNNLKQKQTKPQQNTVNIVKNDKQSNDNIISNQNTKKPQEDQSKIDQQKVEQDAYNQQIQNQQNTSQQQLKENSAFYREKKRQENISQKQLFGFFGQKQNNQQKVELDVYNQQIHFKLPINHQELQKNQQKYPIALFLGSAGVGKTSIIKTIFSGYIINLKEFQLYPARIDDSLIYNFVDTKAFDFESNIDEREQQIKLYQSIFYKYPNKVGSLFVVVNFERTDLMKKKLLSIYKFFRKFSSIIFKKRDTKK